MISGKSVGYQARNSNSDYGGRSASAKVFFTSDEQPPATSVQSNDNVGFPTNEVCTQQISGLFEHTTRHFALRNKSPHIRSVKISAENSRIKVGAVELFENSSLTIAGGGINYPTRNNTNETDRRSATAKVFFASEEQPSTTSVQSNDNVGFSTNEE